MARSGRFGRLPRAAPDLSGAIAALLREAQAQYDSNMVDAWKNGGEVDGKPVNDSRLLAHFKTRRDQLSKDDPLYDEWDNRIEQYQFSIEESKMSLKWDQKKVSEGEMASFYRKWAGKAEKNSEFWRTLLSKAAKWNASAKAGSAARGRSNKYAAHNAWVKDVHGSMVAGGEKAEGWLLAIAKTVGAAEPGAQSLDDVDPNSAAYNKMLDIIEDGKVDDPNVQNMIDAAKKDIAKSDPSFKWSESGFTSILDKADRGHKKLIDNAMSDSERKMWAGRREKMRYEQTRIAQTKPNQRVQIAADTFATDLDHCNGDPYCARDATQKLRAALSKEAGNVVIADMGTQDPYTASALTNTIGQLDTILGGGNVEAPAAASFGATGSSDFGGKGEQTVPKGFTIFDAAAGNGSPNGFLGATGNSINDQTDKLDKGGWLMTEPALSNGQPVLDGEGDPIFNSRVYGPEVPPPAGAVAVSGALSFVDNSRGEGDPSNVGRGGLGPVSRTPVTYVFPTGPQFEFVDANGNKVDTSTNTPKMFSGDTAMQSAPWEELRGVKGPDGKNRTIYRTGTGDPANPYLYHNEPPISADAPKNADGVPRVTVAAATDDKGNPVSRFDVGGLIGGITISRHQTKSGTYVFGTFQTPGGNAASLAIRDAFTSGGPDAVARANGYIHGYEVGISTMKDPAEQAKALSDMGQLHSTVELYQQGKVGQQLSDTYNAQADRVTTSQQTYEQELASRGFTVAKFGQDEVSRRVSLLEGIGELDAQWNQTALNYEKAGQTGLLHDQLLTQQQDLQAQRDKVFNPTVSVSNITVPGMPTMFTPPEQNPTPAFFGVGGYMGGWQPQKFGAPTPGVGGPSFKPPVVPNSSGGPDDRGTGIVTPPVTAPPVAGQSYAVGPTTGENPSWYKPPVATPTPGKSYGTGPTTGENPSWYTPPPTGSTYEQPPKPGTRLF